MVTPKQAADVATASLEEHIDDQLCMGACIIELSPMNFVLFKERLGKKYDEAGWKIELYDTYVRFIGAKTVKGK